MLAKSFMQIEIKATIQSGWLVRNLQSSAQFIALFIVLSITNNAFAESPTNHIPIIQLQTEDRSPSSIGIELGEKTKALFPNITAQYDSYLQQQISQAHFDWLAEKVLPNRLKNLPTDYQQEMQGVAKTWQVHSQNQLGDGKLSFDEYVFLNLMPELGFAPYGIAFSAYGKVTMGNEPIVGRNIDLKHHQAIQHLQTITTYQQSKRHLVNIGFAGIVSVSNGFNERGLFLSLINAEPYSPYPKQTAFDRLPSIQTGAFTLRQALESANNRSQAKHHFNNKPHLFASSLLVADPQSVEIWEYPSNGKLYRRDWHSPLKAPKAWTAFRQIAAVNCLVGKVAANKCSVKDDYRWQRLRQLANFKAEHPVKLSDVSNILFDQANDRYEIFAKETVQSLIFLPDRSELYLYAQSANAPLNHQLYANLVPYDEKGYLGLSWLDRHFIWLGGIALILLFAVIWLMRKRPEKSG